MKFSNGYWLSKKGVSQHHATQVYETENHGEFLEIIAPCREIRTRGDTLEGPVITVQLSSPAPGVIRVRAFHYKGSPDKGPNFEISEAPGFKPEIAENENETFLRSGNISVRIPKSGGFHLDFFDGDKKITSSGWRGLSYIECDDGSVYMKERLDLGVGECVYGLGERFTPFVKNGQSVDIVNADGGTCSEQAYKNIPFYVTSNGYGVFVNDTGKVSFEVASEVVSKVQMSVPGESIEYFVIGGPTIKDVLGRYTGLTGRPALPPAWSFGLWLSTSFVTNYDEKTVNSFVDGMSQRKLPLSVFHFDCFWMKDYAWCDFEWDKRVFPDPRRMLDRLKKKGLKICVWINPYISQQSKLFDEAVQKGYLIKKTDGGVWQCDMWQPGMGIVDFTNPEACEWFGQKLERLCDMGVDCFKTDFGERIPTKGVVYKNGADPEKMHNYYTYLYNKTVFDTVKRKRGEENAIVFARSATAGSQQFPVHWGGDCTADYPSMAESLRGGLSLGLSGFGFWSHDMGGFENTATADVYKRWLAFGLLSSHSRLHGNSSYRVPWLFDDEAVDVLRFFTNLKCRLMPYLYKTACEAHNYGIPVMRAMPIEFQGDHACEMLDRQYMLGSSLLVAPVFSEDGMVSYYLPDGRWTRLLTSETVEGGRWLDEKHDYMSLPVFVRPNSIVAIGSEREKPDYDYTDNVTFLVSNMDDGKTAQTAVFDIRGVKKLEAVAERNGKTITLSVKDAQKPWAALFAGIEYGSVFADGGTAKKDGGMIKVTPDGGSEKIVLHF